MEVLTVAALKEIFKKSLPSIITSFKIKKEDLLNYLEHLLLPHVIERYNKLNTSTSQLFRNTPYQIDKLYVPLTLVRKDTLEEFKVNKYPIDIFKDNRKILINDTAGMGKSTILKMIFRYAVDSQFVLPFYIDLKSLIKDGKVQKVEEYIQNTFPSFINIPSEHFILKQLDTTKFLFLFDGADEVPDAIKSELYSVVNLFCDKCVNSDFIVATRNEEIILSSFYDFTSHNIKSLEKAEAYTLLKKYDFKDVRSEKLIEELEKLENEAVEEFLTNPLLTTLLYMSYSFNRTIPLKKSIFFKQIYQSLYENHDATKIGHLAREKKSGLDIDDFEEVICHLAFVSRLNEKLEYSRDELLETLKGISNLHPTIKFQAKHLIDDLISRVPLLKKDGLTYAWQHKSIQEYFFVRYITKLNSEDKKTKIILGLISSKNSRKYSLVLDILFDEKEDLFHQTITNKIHEILIKDKNDKIDSLGCIDTFQRYIAGYADNIFPDIELYNDENSFRFDFKKAYEFLNNKYEIRGFTQYSAYVEHSSRTYYYAAFKLPETVALSVLYSKKVDFVINIFESKSYHLKRSDHFKSSGTESDREIIFSNFDKPSTEELIQLIPNDLPLYTIDMKKLERFLSNFRNSNLTVNNLIENFNF